jgi:hypothetical protein
VAATIPAGRTFGYTLTLTNTASQPIRLSPCPSYTESLAVTATDAVVPDVSERYFVNCSAAGEIPAGAVMTFEMRMTSPSATGQAKLAWQLSDTEVAAASLVTIRAD